MPEYVVVAGDTFSLISRKTYGTEQEAARISSANPGVNEPLSAGTSIFIPQSASSLDSISRQQSLSTNVDEVAVLINGKRFRFWDSIRVRRSLDSIDTVDFTAPFEPDNAIFLQAIKPFAFNPVSVSVGGVALFTGTMVEVTPLLETGRRVVSVSCYSRPGVLNDCSAPSSAYPIEYKELGLLQIADEVIAPFGLSAESSCDTGAAFYRVGMEVGDKVLGFLSDLAKQRQLFISNSSAGNLVFCKAVETGSPVATLRDGASPLLSVAPRFRPQQYYSHVTGIEPAGIASSGSQYTVRNNALSSALRPISFTVDDAEGGDVKQAVESKYGRMIGSMASYDVTVSTWRDPSGALWAPNTSIILDSPGAMIYGDYEFIIRSVDFNASSGARTARMNLVLPGSFGGAVSERLPWDE